MNTPPIQKVKNWARPFYRSIRPVFPRRRNLAIVKNTNTSFRKKALLSYIVHPFAIDRNSPRFNAHINIWRAVEIVKILNTLGYLVDVIDYRDKEFAPKDDYDLFLGHGGINFEKIVGYLKPEATRVYFSTGSYWKFHNDRELERIKDFRLRRKVDYIPERLIPGNEETALRLADGVIAIGNHSTEATYAGFSPLMINNTVLHDPHRIPQTSVDTGKQKHFLFFAGEGNVHKGLDLLIEAFAGLDLHLWICSPLSSEFKSIYSSIFDQFSNIHPIGKVLSRSEEFHRVADRCGFVILPSCSEGQAHSVLECMQYGLIPVVSRESGIDVDDCGFIIESCTVDSIREIVEDLSSLPRGRLNTLSEFAVQETRDKYAEANFRNDLRVAISKVLRPGGGKRELVLTPCFVDENHRVAFREEAEKRLTAFSDLDFRQTGQGVTEVNRDRWKAAQRFEWISWMTGGGLDRNEDRNREHLRRFGGYEAIRGKRFERGLEIGCGPFTNIVHIAKQAAIKNITLMDPLAEEYLKHPNCAYKNGRLGGIFGKKVETVALPVEEFQPHVLYDLVVMINVLEHCYSMPKVFDCILSMIAPGGIFVFHDKLIPDAKIDEFVEKVYDAGHPLRIAGSLIERFLAENFICGYDHKVLIPSSLGYFDAIYFIGEFRPKSISETR